MKVNKRVAVPRFPDSGQDAKTIATNTAKAVVVGGAVIVTWEVVKQAIVVTTAPETFGASLLLEFLP